MKSKELLLKRIKENDDLLTVINADDERRKDLVQEQRELYDQLISVEKNEGELSMKKQAIEAENYRDKKRNIITVTTWALGTGIAVIMARYSLKYESFGTYTTSVGKAGNNSFITKVFGK